MVIDRDERPKEWPRDPDPEDDAADDLKPWNGRLEKAFKELLLKCPNVSILLMAVTPGDKVGEDQQFHAFTSDFNASHKMARYFITVHSQERKTGGEGDGSEARH